MSLAFEDSGEFLASGGSDGIAHVWRLSKEREVFRVSQPGHLTSLAFGEGGRSLVIATGYKVAQQGVADRPNTCRSWPWRARDVADGACDLVKANGGGRHPRMPRSLPWRVTVPKDIKPPPRERAERFFNVQRWTTMPQGVAWNSAPKCGTKQPPFQRLAAARHVPRGCAA